MEEDDPESEYSSSKEVETSMMKWILNKGYGIGKKMIITGIAISAAPLVLPPIVVFSAMGVAFSVPSGLVFATYACTNKLMRTLLPTPPSPVMLLEYYSDGDEQQKGEGVDKGYYMGEYEDDYGRQVDVLVTNVDGNIDEKGYDYTDEEEGDDVVFELDDGGDDYGHAITSLDENIIGEGCNDDENELDIVQQDDYMQQGEGIIMNANETVDEKRNGKEVEDDVAVRENVIKEEEIEQMEDIKQEVEMRLGLDVGSDENVVGKSCHVDENKEEKVPPDDYKEEGEDLLMNVDDIVDEKSYYTNENGDKKETKDVLLLRENVIKEEEIEQMEDIKQEVEDVGLITNFGSGVDEQGYEEDVEDDDSLGEENIGKDMFVESRMDENKNNIQEATEDEKEVVESTRLLKKTGDDGLVDNDIIIKDESASNVGIEEVKDFEKIEPDVMVKEIESQELVQNGSKTHEHVGKMRHVVILAGGNEGNNLNSREIEELDLVARAVVGDGEKDARNIESDGKVMRESMGEQEQTVGVRTSNDETENAILRTKKEELISSNADARKISDESGFDLFDEQSTNMNFGSLEAGGGVKENGDDENVVVLALPAFKGSTLDTDSPTVTAKTDAKMPTKEDILDENIWEKIGAMRAIVGYKLPSQPTCIEELKALYVFTGVEPPVSFDGNSGLDEVNDKLKFLMSIVGVK